MKTLFLTLLLSLSLPVLAKSDSPIGLFQVDSSHSPLTQSGEQQALSGFIDIKEEFPASRFVLETGDGLFESTEVSGDLANFEVRGNLNSGGVSKEVKLTGTYFGTVEEGDTHEKVVMKLVSGDCVTSVFAVRPKAKATELFNNVREIVR